MADAAKLSASILSRKPNGILYSNFFPTQSEVQSVIATKSETSIEYAYSASVSFCEAMKGISEKSISWSIIKLYYTCYFCIKSLLVINDVVPFNLSGEHLFDLKNGKFFKGGTSSHAWNWGSFRKISHLQQLWFFSDDSQSAYGKIRSFREDVNYRNGFTDPNLHSCLISHETNLSKKFRSYRDDFNFIYTYLDEHVILAYTIKLIYELENTMKSNSLFLSDEQRCHLASIWKIKDRCPLA